MSSPARAEGYDTAAQQRDDSWHEQTIFTPGVKLFFCSHGKGRRDLSAEHSMRMSIYYGGPARGQCDADSEWDSAESNCVLMLGQGLET